MTEYMVLIVGDEARWTSMTDQERSDNHAQFGALEGDLATGRHKVTGGAELHASTTARTIRPGGETVTAGPFAETAEQVGGFYLVETEDLDGLSDCFRRIARLGNAIEIRPTVSAQDRL